MEFGGYTGRSVLPRETERKVVALFPRGFSSYFV